MLIILFLDGAMPVMDGKEATIEIRRLEKAEPTRRRTPIIATTANVIAGAAQDYLSGGMDAYLAKPIIIAELKSALRKFGGL